VLSLTNVRQLVARQSTTFHDQFIVVNLLPALNISSSQSGQKPDFFCLSIAVNFEKAGKITAIVVPAKGIHYPKLLQFPADYRNQIPRSESRPQGGVRPPAVHSDWISAIPTEMTALT
jgi:hypothetical protein